MATDLSKVGAEEFEAAVNADVRGTASSETQTALRQPDVLDRWHDTLLLLKRNVEAQLTSNRATLLLDQAEKLGQHDTIGWIKLKAESEQWRQRSIRFKNGVEGRLREAKRLRTERGESVAGQALRERDRAMVDLITYREAIAKHREAVLANPDDSETADETLWATIGRGA